MFVLRKGDGFHRATFIFLLFIGGEGEELNFYGAAFFATGENSFTFPFMLFVIISCTLRCSSFYGAARIGAFNHSRYFTVPKVRSHDPTLKQKKRQKTKKQKKKRKTVGLLF